MTRGHEIVLEPYIETEYLDLKNINLEPYKSRNENHFDRARAATELKLMPVR